MFRARHRADSKILRVLHPKFVKAKNYPAALMCLDSAFASTLPLQGAPPADPGPDLRLHFAYFELLDRLRREDSLNTGSIRQKVFAFQPREDDRFFVPANSFLYMTFLSRPDTMQEKGGCVVTHEELRRTLGREIPEYIRLRAKEQNNAYRRRLGATPCLTMVTKGECPKVDCQFQHVRPEKMTAGWFNARIQLVLTEIQILNLAGFHPPGAILCVLHWQEVGTTPDSDLVSVGTGLVSFTLASTPRYRSLGLSRRWTLGTRREQWKGSEFCESGSGRHVTNSPSIFQACGGITTKNSSSTSCPFVRWRMTSTSSKPRRTYLAPGCVVIGSGRNASLGQGSERKATSSSGTSSPSYRGVPTIH